jgi:RNA polymerase sigma-70 factor (ECF subfamily)
VDELRQRLAKSVHFRFALNEESFARRVAEILPKDGRTEGLHLDDLYLATACAAGEEAAWQELERRHFSFIRDFAARCVPREPAAGDVADAVIADLWRRGKIRQFAGRSALRTWLGTVVAHTAWNALKSARKTVSLEERGQLERIERSGALAAPPEDSDRVAHQRLALLAAERLAALPPPSKLLLLLYYEHGMTLEEMVVALGSSKASLSRRLKRVRESLRAEIESRAAGAGLPAEGLGGAIDFSRVEIDLASLLAGRLSE